MHKTFLLLLLAVSCSSATSEPRDVTVGQQVELRTDEWVHVAGSTVSVAFTGAADSRCPSDATCVWAGEAMIRLHFTGAGSDRVDTLRAIAQPRTATYGDYRFEVVSLLPYPTNAAPNADKRLTLSVTPRS